MKRILNWIIGSILWYPLLRKIKKSINQASDKAITDQYIDILTIDTSFQKCWYGKKYLKLLEKRLANVVI